MTDAVHPAIVQAAWSAVGAVPGCTPLGVRYVDTGTTGGTSRSASVDLTGWSPSLHRVRHDWRIPLDVGSHRTRPAHEVHAEAMTRQLRGHVAVQRRRAGEGLALGHATPIEADDRDGCDVSHMHVDASLLAFVLAGDGGSVEEMVAVTIGRRVAQLHRKALMHRGGMHLQTAGIAVEDEAGVHHVVPVVDIGALAPRIDGSPEVVMTGSSVLMSGIVLPETAVTAMGGRTMAEAADVHPALAARRIATAERGDDWVAITLEPVRVRIGDVYDMGVREARARLRAIHG